MRPLNLDGSWGDKQKKEYLLDKNGNKIYDPRKRQYKCDTVATTDWNEQSKAEQWRQMWAAFSNRALADSQVAVSIDHRSYERQGINKIPTVHMGVAASQMEQRGIPTEKGNLHQMVQQDNRLIRELESKIRELTDWLKESQSPPKSVLGQLAYYKNQLKQTEKQQQPNHKKHDLER